jgi:hypothetical protein
VAHQDLDRAAVANRQVQPNALAQRDAAAESQAAQDSDFRQPLSLLAREFTFGDEAGITEVGNL